jgi:autotransporter-associated beta strand protein
MTRPWKNWIECLGFRGSEGKGRSRKRQQPSRPQSRRATPGLEVLEDRTVPTVLFNSPLGGDTISWGANWWGQTVGQTVTSPITNNPGALNDPTVYLIFWGPSWTQSTASQYASDAQTIIQSQYLSRLTDYGSDGIATYGGYTIDNSTSSLGPVAATNEIDHVLPQMSGWAKPTQPTSLNIGPPGHQIWPGVVTSPIYVVVSDLSNNAGGNGPDAYVPQGTSGTPLAMNHVWIGAGVNEALFTDILSHELAERISSGGAGIVMNASVDAGTDHEWQNAQIADNEPDGGNYLYPLNGTVSEQAYWSISAHAFIVPDGNSETIAFNPHWDLSDPAHPHFLNTFDLNISGDPSGSTITLDVPQSGPTAGELKVTDNGQVFWFSPSKLSSITITETGTGNNVVNVLRTPTGVPVTIIGHGHDTVNLGVNGSVQGIRSGVSISNPANSTSLNIDDSSDPTALNPTIAASFLTGLIPNVTINYANIGSLLLKTGTGSNAVTVNPGGAPSTVDVHGGSNTSLTVQGYLNAQPTVAYTITPTALTLTYTDLIYPHESVTNTIRYENLTSLSLTTSGVPGTVQVTRGPGLPTLNVNGQGDTSLTVRGDPGVGTPVTDTVTGTAVTDQYTFVAVNPPRLVTETDTINYTGVSSLTLDATAIPNSVNVQSTSVPTNVVANGATSQVNVGNSGSVQGIQGTLNIEDPPAFIPITIDDSADPAARSVTLSTLGTNPADSQHNQDPWGQIIGLAPAHINYEYGDATSLTIRGGANGDTFQVTNVPPVPVILNGTGGTNTLHGPNQANAWTLNAAHGGVLDGNITFNGFQNLAGGTGGDTFTLSSGVPVAMNLKLNSAATLTTASGSQTLSGAIDTQLGQRLTVTGAGNASLQGAISGLGGLTKQGSGTVALSGANTYGDTTVVAAGTLLAGAPGTLFTTALLVGAGATCIFNNYNQSAGLLSDYLGGGGSVLLGSATLVLGSNLPATFSGVISGNGPVSLVKNGPNTQTLRGANTYTGATRVYAGTLRAGAVNTLPSAGDVSLASGATLDLNGFNQSISTLSDLNGGGGTVTLGSATLTVGTQNRGSLFHGVLSGIGGGLTLAGGGANLFGSNTYTGTTTVQAGVLAVFGSQAASPVVVTGTGRLTGTGTVGPVTVTGNGSVSVGGGGSGVLSAGGAVFSSSTSSFVTTLNSTSSYGRLNATGAVDLTQHPTLTVQPGFAANVGDTFTIVSSTAGVTGTFANLPDGTAFFTGDGQRFSIHYTSSSVTLTRIGLTPNERFVADVYPDLLGRPADPAGLAYWGDQLDAGAATRAQVTAALVGSAEYRVRTVEGFYLQYLHRPADLPGLQAAVAAWAAGATQEQLKAAFLASPEYFALHGGSNTGFVQALYLDALGRPADPAGLAAAVNALAQGGSRATLALALLQSSEGEQLVVNGLYLRLLHRPADPPALAADAAALQQGALRDEQLAAVLAASPEYFQNV